MNNRAVPKALGTK